MICLLCGRAMTSGGCPWCDSKRIFAISPPLEESWDVSEERTEISYILSERDNYRSQLKDQLDRNHEIGDIAKKELATLRARVAELEGERERLVEWQSAALDDEKDLPGEIAVLRVDLAHTQDILMLARETEEVLAARVAELEAWQVRAVDELGDQAVNCSMLPTSGCCEDCKNRERCALDTLVREAESHPAATEQPED
jgi:BMFP domain-containing protein YqiC